VALQVEAGDAGHIFAAVSVASNFRLAKGGSAAVIKVRKSDMSIVGTHAFSTADNMAYSLAMDAAFVYGGQYTYPGRVSKIDKRTMTVAGALTLPTGMNDVRWLFKDTTNPRMLFALTNTQPGHVARVDMDSMKLLRHARLNDGCNNPLAGVSGAFDPNFLYVGTNTRPGRIIKVAKDTLQQVSDLPLSEGENTVVSVQSDAASLYVATYTKPGFVMQIRKSDMRVVGKLPLAIGEDKITALVHGKGHLYAATDTVQGRLVRLKGFRYWPLKSASSLAEVKRRPNLQSHGYSADLNPDVMPLEHCHGDCDHDHHCATGYVCHQQNHQDPIPGCAGTPNEGMDYCVRQPDVAAAAAAVREAA
jgi:hypothetical protein